jgi:hypothetical protein
VNDVRSHLVNGHALCHGSHGLGYQVGSVRANDVAAYEFARVGAVEYLHQAISFAHGASFAVAGKQCFG